MITVVAEKPSVARDIAKYLGADIQKNGYLEGNNYLVTWAIGHLVQIKDFEELGYSNNWNLESLPFIPDEFHLKISKGKENQFKVIKSLFEKSEKIICATDAGREGELIFRYIYNLSRSNIKVERLWISSLTDQAIKDGFNNLKKGSAFENLYKSAKARNQADFIVGINSTIGMTAKANAGLLSLGRVQTPTLALICKRYLQFIEFVPVPFYTPEILLFPLNKLEFKARFERHFELETDAISILNSIDLNLVVKDLINKQVNDNPPLLFDLTSLQMEANKKFGLSAQETLKVAQSLYETHKVLTYPRTSSKYLSEDMISSIPGLFNDILNYHESKSAIKSLIESQLSLRPIDNDKVTDHHAIIPTEKKPDFKSFTTDELNIFNLVVTRFLEAFMPVCIKESVTVIVDSQKGEFRASGTVIKVNGWRGISGVFIDEDDSDSKTKIPQLKIGEKLSVIKKEVVKGLTKPLPLFTESSLLHSMETAGKLVDDVQLALAMKEGGLGTPATRASIIELLIKRSYIIREKKNILPTELGLSLFNLVKDLKIAKPELTGEWENKLMMMENGQYSYDIFNSEINQYTLELIDSIKALKIENMNKEIIDCPYCKVGKIIEKGNQYSCSKNGDDCNFPIIWKKISEQTINSSHVIELVKYNKTSIIKGFKNKEEKKFDASLIIDKETKKLKFDFTKNVIADCPKCKSGKVEDYTKTVKCNNNSKCDFVIFKEIAQKKINQNDLIKLIKDGRTNLIKGLTSKTGSSFDAILKFDSDFKVTFEFLKK